MSCHHGAVPEPLAVGAAGEPGAVGAAGEPGAVGAAREPGVVGAARRLADELLFPDAAAVDAADRVPRAHLSALDATGLTGLATADATAAERFDVAAALAGGCLSTAFVWLQHQGALSAAAAAGCPEAVPLASGALRGGVAITGLRSPAALRIRRSAGGWTLTGRVPWVTGWGTIEVLRVAALDGDDVVRTVLLEVPASSRLRVEPLRLTAAAASGTCTLEFDGLPVPDDRLLTAVPLVRWSAADGAGLGTNGALALGVAERAARLAGSARLLDALAVVRQRLLTADPATLPAARAACSALAVRAAAALTVREGARSVLAGSAAERLTREAQFLLVFGSRPAIRDALRTAFDA